MEAMQLKLFQEQREQMSEKEKKKAIQMLKDIAENLKD